jgi:hypothetical protein
VLVSLGVATETTTAGGVTPSAVATVALGVAVEQAVAREVAAVPGGVLVPLGVAAETAVAFEVVAARSVQVVPLGVAWEQVTARALTLWQQLIVAPPPRVGYTARLQVGAGHGATLEVGASVGAVLEVGARVGASLEVGARVDVALSVGSARTSRPRLLRAV